MTAAPAVDYEALARELEDSEDYRVLRRFVPDPATYLKGDAPPADCSVGLYVDCETTGLDTANDRIIELALVPFLFDADGAVYDVGKGTVFLEDPRQPLSAEIVALTGITDDQLKGQAIGDAEVKTLVDQSALVISHRAGFDRKFLERRLPVFTEKAWGCSWADVPWQDTFGTRAGRLEIILADVMRQFSAGAHRATDDCHVGVHLLANAVRDGRTALSYLRESTRRFQYRVWAIESPFQSKDKLKGRGYRWELLPKDLLSLVSASVREKKNDEVKCWHRDVRADEVNEELVFARDIGGSKRVHLQKIGARDRYSVRAS